MTHLMVVAGGLGAGLDAADDVAVVGRLERAALDDGELDVLALDGVQDQIVALGLAGPERRRQADDDGDRHPRQHESPGAVALADGTRGTPVLSGLRA